MDPMDMGRVNYEAFCSAMSAMMKEADQPVPEWAPWATMTDISQASWLAGSHAVAAAWAEVLDA